MVCACTNVGVYCCFFCVGDCLALVASRAAIYAVLSDVWRCNQSSNQKGPHKATHAGNAREAPWPHPSKQSKRSSQSHTCGQRRRSPVAPSQLHLQAVYHKYRRRQTLHYHRYYHEVMNKWLIIETTDYPHTWQATAEAHTSLWPAVALRDARFAAPCVLCVAVAVPGCRGRLLHVPCSARMWLCVCLYV